jgi:ribosome-binding protein aMBF1 (putative translation factor)
MDRCTNPNSPNYKHYGGKGITVCQRWAESFKHFHDDMGDRPPGTSIDRIDPNGNYEPLNCRWATNREQRMNQARSTISIEQAAEVRRLRELHGWGQNTIAKHLGISPGAAGGVIYLGNLAT